MRDEHHSGRAPGRGEAGVRGGSDALARAGKSASDAAAGVLQHGPAPGQDHLLARLYEAADRFTQEVMSRARAEGYLDIRPGHGCVFGNVPPEGARLTKIAEDARLTKQAVGEVATELEHLGYLVREPDPSDGRAKILRLTERGLRAQEAGRRIIAEVEAEWEQRYGADRVRAMREVLEQIAAERDAGRATAAAFADVVGAGSAP